MKIYKFLYKIPIDKDQYNFLILMIEKMCDVHIFLKIIFL